ncbi:unnamed protein product [Hymenolepis diminuta]|uniref:Uncharacterized protein n=1 Tax=Hymenolepis diminuta TaxID=6216 RepID=A0A3P6ZRF1_HYMDI|nr:unnamed protein product [Hymenolepis diminuta]
MSHCSAQSAPGRIDSAQNATSSGLKPTYLPIQLCRLSELHLRSSQLDWLHSHDPDPSSGHAGSLNELLSQFSRLLTRTLNLEIIIYTPQVTIILLYKVFKLYF